MAANRVIMTHSVTGAHYLARPGQVAVMQAAGWELDEDFFPPPAPGSTHATLDDLASLPSAVLPAFGPGSKQVGMAVSPATGQALRWVGLGDSVAYVKMRWMFSPLNQAFGGGLPGLGISTGQNGTGWTIPGITFSTTGTVTDAVGDFDAWFSGLAARFATGATRSYGVLGSAATWDTAKVYYVKGPSANGKDGGTFKIQVDGVDEQTGISASNASITLGVATVTKGSVAQRTFTVANTAGTARVVGVAFYNSAQGGVHFSGISQGGISLQDATSAAALANLGIYLADFDPDVVSLECKENSSYYATALAALMGTVRTACPRATILGIGSTPVSSGDADQRLQNTQLRQACGVVHGTYWDGYTPIGSYVQLAALGWHGDGTHVADAANAFLAGLLLRDLGILNHPAVRSGRTVDTTNVWARNRIDLGKTRSDGNATANGAIVPDNTFGFDFDVLCRRWMRVLPYASSIPNAFSWLFCPDNTLDQQIPSGVRVGTTNGPRLFDGGSNTLRVTANAAGSTYASLEALGLRAMGGAWNSGPLRLGAHYLWVDATGALRIKSSAPTSDTDGAVVGTQT